MAADKQTRPDPGTRPRSAPASDARSLGSIIELPIVLVVAVVVGGWLGHFVDQWLHKDGLFTLILGGLGFAAGILEILRRLSRAEKREEKGNKN